MHETSYQDLIIGILFFGQIIIGFLLLRNFDLSGKSSLFLSSATSLVGWVTAFITIMLNSGIQC